MSSRRRSKKGQGRPMAPWTLAAVEVLQDEKWHDYSDVFKIVMDSIPPNRAVRSYLSISRNTKNLAALSDQITSGSNHLARQSLRAKRFIIADKDGNQISGFGGGADNWKIRMKTKEELAVSFRRNNTKELHKFAKDRFWTNFDSYKTLESTEDQQSQAAIAKRILLLTPANAIQINGVLLDSPRIVYRPTKTKRKIISENGYLVENGDNINKYAIFVVWPWCNPPIFYKDIREVVRDGWLTSTKYEKEDQ